MCFKNAYFQQTFGRIMGTNLAPIMPNLYLAMLQAQQKDQSCYTHH